MIRPRSIAAAQTVPIPGDVAANLEQHVRLAEAAADAGAQIAVFPELSLTGYELPLADELAFSETDRRLSPLVRVATSRSMILVAGAPVRLGDDLFIGAFVLTPDGRIDLHTKRYLGAFPGDVNPGGSVPPREDSIFRAGTRTPLVVSDGTSAAIGICAESLQWSHAEEAAGRGATLYLTSHFGIPLDVGFRASILRGHAARLSMIVVFSDYGGPTGGLDAGGKSAIWSEKGELVAELGPSGCGVAIATAGDGGWTGKTVALDT